MTIFARMFSRLRTRTTARGTTQHRSRALTFQPLEERRLLAAVPNNFLVENLVDSFVDKDDARGHESEIKLTWVDNGANRRLRDSELDQWSRRCGGALAVVRDRACR